MNIILEEPPSKLKKAIAFLIFIGMVSGSFILGLNLTKANAETIRNNSFSFKNDYPKIATINGDTILAISSPTAWINKRKVKKIRMLITAYSSDPWQTDDTPFITASGTRVKQGIVANNLLPFGTKIMIPSLYGNKIFIVEDRMNPRNSYYHLDIWFPDYWQAKNFGAKTATIEILK